MGQIDHFGVIFDAKYEIKLHQLEKCLRIHIKDNVELRRRGECGINLHAYEYR